IQHLEMPQYYSGLQGIGFVKRVSQEEKKWFLSAMRRQTPSFDIWPSGTRHVYYTVMCIEPLDRYNKAVIGYDAFTEEVRRTAMETACDTATPTASGKTRLIQDVGGERPWGFLIYIPVYRHWPAPASISERQKTLAGFIYASIRFDDFLGTIFPAETSRRL